MVVLRRKIAISISIALLIGAGFLAYRWQNPSNPFPRFTIDADGSVIKQLPALSSESLARIPSMQLKGLIFGINPVVLETAAPRAKDTERVVFVVENVRSDIQREYEEYFTALGWTYSLSQDATQLTVRTKNTYTAITFAPRSQGGSLISITRSTLP